ncbi:hypothetical protein CPAR01_10260 [Colletotrichum paranaense]|uniref:Uncharacterized protein n=1 Tax=Colletotrichum paranaense TaxID=1914294 RepID=A0ABQ9SEV8_9PEZI|nr:uncharacterized protein CPAR01_10260 [Colletotrichum paranaense]KAK1533552.1 hypothetical protein CPAR01_10260 [Colletotrichum paranaense]
MKFAGSIVLATLVALASAQPDPQHYRHLNGKRKSISQRGFKHSDRILPLRRSTVAYTLETPGLTVRRTRDSAATGITCSKMYDTMPSIVAFETSRLVRNLRTV